MSMVGGVDIHRGQLTYDYIDLETGELHRGQVRPANRRRLRAWLGRFAGTGGVAFAIEACTGWRYVAEELARAGYEVHLAEPAETAEKKGPKRRAKTDEADARHLRELLQQGRVPESWIPPAGILEARSLIRLYLDLGEERGAWMERINATLFHQGAPAMDVLTSVGQAQLEKAELSPEGRRAVVIAQRQVDRLDKERELLAAEIEKASKAQIACQALVKELYGVGWLLAYAIWAEMGDVRRFPSSRDVIRYAGIDITVKSSGDRRAMGSLSRQGSPVLRWALYEAAMAASRKSSPDHVYYCQVKARRQGDGKVALQSVARKMARRSYHIMYELGAEAWPTAA